MSGKEPLNRNPVIASRRKCRLKDSSDGIFREGRDALEKTAFQAGILFARQRGGIGRAGKRTGGGSFMPSESPPLRLFAKKVGKGTYNPVQSSINI